MWPRPEYAATRLRLPRRPSLPCACNERADSLVRWFRPLCAREIATMRRFDRRQAISFVDVASETAIPTDRSLLLKRFHAQERGAAIVSGTAAFAAMWRAIPVLRPLGLIARNAFVLHSLERLYTAFLRIRPILAVRGSPMSGRRSPVPSAASIPPSLTATSNELSAWLSHDTTRSRRDRCQSVHLPETRVRDLPDHRGLEAKHSCPMGP